MTSAAGLFGEFVLEGDEFGGVEVGCVGWGEDGYVVFGVGVGPGGWDERGGRVEELAEMDWWEGKRREGFFEGSGG